MSELDFGANTHEIALDNKRRIAELSVSSTSVQQEVDTNTANSQPKHTDDWHLTADDHNPSQPEVSKPQFIQVAEWVMTRTYNSFSFVVNMQSRSLFGALWCKAELGNNVVLLSGCTITTIGSFWSGRVFVMKVITEPNLDRPGENQYRFSLWVKVNSWDRVLKTYTNKIGGHRIQDTKEINFELFNISTNSDTTTTVEPAGTDAARVG